MNASFATLYTNGNGILTRTEAYLSLPRLLKSCANSSALSPGSQLHAISVKLDLCSDVFIQTALLSFYSYCGYLDTALQLFDRMPHRNLITWTAAIDACLRSDHPHLALSLFVQMRESGIVPDTFTLVSFLAASSSLCALDLGRGAHAHLSKTGTELTPFLATALVDMYCKCGSLDDAIKMFDLLPNSAKTVQVWNSMLHGLSLHGLGMNALQMFDEMRRALVQPNSITFVALLCGCAHAGLVEEGKMYFGLMRSKYGIEPGVKHFGCMVDLLGRAGLIDEAFDMVASMPVPANHVIWGALLNACRINGNIKMAEIVLDRIVTEEQTMSSTSHYLIMSNIYRDAGFEEKTAELRIKVGRKPTGRSWIEIAGEMHKFMVGVDAFSHPMWKEIKTMLDEMARTEGKQMLEQSENIHSEKIAVAFGLIRTSAPTPIRISKNLRICQDCHDTMKVVSQAYKREIVVRDCNRFHRFMGGLCSCKDYW
ncbi:Pentatricopeptide repeat-containing protein [Dioscorea alata]|uniref:Pentatricopeptide repeat-containing protein n=1 Tax=Dioscorea alata TaxID=55571 RepID=A0ACB7UVE0_DIOAL|nr:Pentatricopeptide repeat-containing protein [Dioscorea alata]